jgi:hypothetical protein
MMAKLIMIINSYNKLYTHTQITTITPQITETIKNKIFKIQRKHTTRFNKK